MDVGRYKVIPVLAAAGVVVASPAVAADHQGWKTTADVGRAGLIALAFGKSAVEGDWKGAEQATLTIGGTAAATAGLKHAFPEMRPDGSDDRSFPSDHASTAFAAAGYLGRRYGWKWGLPATVAATVVGVARVESKDHHWYDVVAGAALGEAAAFVFTKPRDDSIRFLPWAGPCGGGVLLTARF